MSAVQFTLSSISPENTAQLALRLSEILRPGDTLLLSGDIGAGKTHFARHLIQALLDYPEDVPSPTFTLIQSYDTKIGEILHADLYRLSGPEEIVELGLMDAFGTLVCLVEWPDRLGPDAPKDALHLTFETTQTDDGRTIHVSSADPQWANRLKELADV